MFPSLGPILAQLYPNSTKRKIRDALIAHCRGARRRAFARGIPEAAENRQHAAANGNARTTSVDVVHGIKTRWMNFTSAGPAAAVAPRSHALILSRLVDLHVGGEVRRTAGILMRRRRIQGHTAFGQRRSIPRTSAVFTVSPVFGSVMRTTNVTLPGWAGSGELVMNRR